MGNTEAKKRLILPKVISEEKILKGLLQVENLNHKSLLVTAYDAGLTHIAAKVPSTVKFEFF